MRSVKITKDGESVILTESGEVTLHGKKYHAEIDFENGNVNLSFICDGDGIESKITTGSHFLSSETLSLDDVSEFKEPYIVTNSVFFTENGETLFNGDILFSKDGECVDCIKDVDFENSNRVVFSYNRGDIDTDEEILAFVLKVEKVKAMIEKILLDRDVEDKSFELVFRENGLMVNNLVFSFVNGTVSCILSASENDSLNYISSVANEIVKNGEYDLYLKNIQATYKCDFSQVHKDLIGNAKVVSIDMGSRHSFSYVSGQEFNTQDYIFESFLSYLLLFKYATNATKLRVYSGTNSSRVDVEINHNEVDGEIQKTLTWLNVSYLSPSGLIDERRNYLTKVCHAINSIYVDDMETIEMIDENDALVGTYYSYKEMFMKGDSLFAMPIYKTKSFKSNATELPFKGINISDELCESVRELPTFSDMSIPINTVPCAIVPDPEDEQTYIDEVNSTQGLSEIRKAINTSNETSFSTTQAMSPMDYYDAVKKGMSDISDKDNSYSEGTSFTGKYETYRAIISANPNANIPSATFTNRVKFPNLLLSDSTTTLNAQAGYDITYEASKGNKVEVFNGVDISEDGFYKKFANKLNFIGKLYKIINHTSTRTGEALQYFDAKQPIFNLSNYDNVADKDFIESMTTKVSTLLETEYVMEFTDGIFTANNFNSGNPFLFTAFKVAQGADSGIVYSNGCYLPEITPNFNPSLNSTPQYFAKCQSGTSIPEPLTINTFRYSSLGFAGNINTVYKAGEATFTYSESSKTWVRSDTGNVNATPIWTTSPILERRISDEYDGNGKRMYHFKQIRELQHTIINHEVKAHDWHGKPSVEGTNEVTYTFTKLADGSVEVTWSNPNELQPKFFTVGNKKVYIGEN